MCDLNFWWFLPTLHKIINFNVNGSLLPARATSPCAVVLLILNLREGTDSISDSHSIYDSVKVILQYCTAHPLLRTISHVISARALKNGGFFFTAGPRHGSKSSFLRKRVWWPIIFFCCFELNNKFL